MTGSILSSMNDTNWRDCLFTHVRAVFDNFSFSNYDNTGARWLMSKEWYNEYRNVFDYSVTWFEDSPADSSFHDGYMYGIPIKISPGVNIIPMIVRFNGTGLP